jgi:hypothetical protein
MVGADNYATLSNNASHLCRSVVFLHINDLTPQDTLAWGVIQPCALIQPMGVWVSVTCSSREAWSRTDR